MSDAKELKPDGLPKAEVDQLDDKQLLEDAKNSEIELENPPSCPEQEEEMIKKKYGGLLRKKPPLISKDHDHAFFDSADWALGKQGSQKSKGPLEALRPKLQPTPHQQLRSRHSAYAPPEGDVADGVSDPSVDLEKELEGDNVKNDHPGSKESE